MGEPILREAKRLQEVGQEHLARMDWRDFLGWHEALLVVVDDLDVSGICARPAETDPPLIVDPDTVLPGAIAFELLQSVTGRHAEIVERLGGIDGHEFAQHDPAEVQVRRRVRPVARRTSRALHATHRPLPVERENAASSAALKQLVSDGLPWDTRLGMRICVSDSSIELGALRFCHRKRVRTSIRLLAILSQISSTSEAGAIR